MQSKKSLKQNTKRLVRLAFFTAIALILSLIENALPPLLYFAPGVKMGLSNVVTLLALILMSFPDAIIILLIRCVLASVFGGNVSALMYSIPAGLTSLVIEWLLYRFVFPKISILALSFTGAVIHNIVQLIIASLIVSFNLFAVLPLTLIASIIAGLFIGAATFFTVKYLPEKLYT